MNKSLDFYLTAQSLLNSTEPVVNNTVLYT